MRKRMTNKDAIKIIQYGLIDENFPVVSNVAEEALNMAIKALENERPQGEWITKEYSIEYYCSRCGERLDQCCENFCCHCGADMRGGENDES